MIECNANDKGLWVLTFATIVFQSGLYLFDVLQVISCNLSWFLGPHPKSMKFTQQFWFYPCQVPSFNMNPNFVHTKFQVSTSFKVWSGIGNFQVPTSWLDVIMNLFSKIKKSRFAFDLLLEWSFVQCT